MQWNSVNSSSGYEKIECVQGRKKTAKSNIAGIDGQEGVERKRPKTFCGSVSKLFMVHAA